MSGSETRRLGWPNLFWSVAIFVAIVLCVWGGRSFRNIWFYGLVLLVMISIHFFYGEGPRRIGFWPDSFKSCFLKHSGKLFGLVGLILFFSSCFWTIKYTDPLRIAQNLGANLLWGVFQQYLLNGFFVNRLVGLVGEENDPRVPWVAGALFALVHTPNWFLMLVTFFGGWACAKIFLSHKDDRNLYFLGLAHGLVSLSLHLFVPDAIAHGFVVGPRYFIK